MSEQNPSDAPIEQYDRFILSKHLLNSEGGTMTIEEVSNNENIDFTGIPSSYYLLGLISAFENRFQALADSMMTGMFLIF